MKNARKFLAEHDSEVIDRTAVVDILDATPHKPIRVVVDTRLTFRHTNKSTQLQNDVIHGFAFELPLEEFWTLDRGCSTPVRVLDYKNPSNAPERRPYVNPQYTKIPVKDFVQIGQEIGKLLQEKNAAYGNSFEEAEKVLRTLFPNGVGVEQYKDLLAVTRVLDKLFRIATNKTAFAEDPWRDIAGYAILSLWSAQRAGEVSNGRDATE